MLCLGVGGTAAPSALFHVGRGQEVLFIPNLLSAGQNICQSRCYFSKGCLQAQMGKILQGIGCQKYSVEMYRVEI